MTRFCYSATLEFTEAAPETATGTVEAGTARNAARLAVDELLTQHPGRRWSSLVLVLMKPEAPA